MKRASPIGPLVALLPALLLSFGIYTFVSTCAFLAHAERAEGRVVDLVPHTIIARGHTSTSWYPRIHFHTVDNHDVEFVGRIYADPQGALAPGASLELFYNPADPKQVRLAFFSDLWEPSLLFAAFGSMFIALPMMALGLFRREARREAKALSGAIL